MDPATRARSQPSRGRWIAADYSRLIGLRTVPAGLFLLGFAVIGPRVGHFLPVFVQVVVIYAAGVGALLGTAEIEVRYRRSYGSVSSIPPPRRYFWLYSAVSLIVLTLVLLRGARLLAPLWWLGSALIFWSLPFEGGGIRRVRWHFVAAGLAIGVLATLDIHVAVPFVALLAIVFGVADHVVYTRRFPKPSAEPAGV